MKSNVVFLGDSITAGVIAGPELDYRELGYARYIKQYMQETSQLGSYYNFAVSGFMTGDVLKQLDQDIYHNENIAFNILDEAVYKMTKKKLEMDTIKFVHPDVRIRDCISNADLLVMTCSANDLIRLFRRANEESASTIIKSILSKDYTEDTLQNALKNYMVIINLILMLNPNIEIVIMANYFPTHDDNITKLLYDKFTKIEDALFDTLADGFGEKITILKPRELFKEHADEYLPVLIDIHPSDVGHQALADFVLSNQKTVAYSPGKIFK